MRQLSRVWVTVVLGLGVVYPGWAQTGTAGERSSDPRPGAEQGSQRGVPARERFEHPMLERPSSTDMRSDQGPRIQRRGMQDIHQDGTIERHVDPAPAQRQKPRAGERRVPQPMREPAAQP